jgi:hypothetical protein
MKAKKNKSALENSMVIEETATFLAIALSELKKADLVLHTQGVAQDSEFYKYFEEIKK